MNYSFRAFWLFSTLEGCEMCDIHAPRAERKGETKTSTYFRRDEAEFFPLPLPFAFILQFFFSNFYCGFTSRWPSSRINNSFPEIDSSINGAWKMRSSKDLNRWLLLSFQASIVLHVLKSLLASKVALFTYR